MIMIARPNPTRSLQPDGPPGSESVESASRHLHSIGIDPVVLAMRRDEIDT
jgi:hypothetical protein